MKLFLILIFVLQVVLGFPSAYADFHLALVSAIQSENPRMRLLIQTLSALHQRSGPRLREVLLSGFDGRDRNAVAAFELLRQEYGIFDGLTKRSKILFSPSGNKMKFVKLEMTPQTPAAYAYVYYALSQDIDSRESAEFVDAVAFIVHDSLTTAQRLADGLSAFVASLDMVVPTVRFILMGDQNLNINQSVGSIRLLDAGTPGDFYLVTMDDSFNILKVEHYDEKKQREIVQAENPHLSHSEEQAFALLRSACGKLVSKDLP